MSFPNLKQFSHFAYDTETTGLKYPVDKAFGFSISTPDNKDYYYDIRTNPNAARWISDTFADYRGVVICHNAAFDALMSKAAGINVKYESLSCTIVRACLIDEHLATKFPWNRHQRPGGYNLDYVGNRYIGRGKIDIDIENISELPEEEVSEYACYDTRTTLLLWEWQELEIERQKLQKIDKFERQVTPRLIRSMERGIRVDLEEATKAHDRLGPRIDTIQKELNYLVGRNYNVNSPKQTREIFEPKEINGVWYANNVRIGRTDKGQPSFSGEFMHNLADVDERASKVIQLRSAIKTRDTFLAQHVLGHNYRGRVYPTINQTAGERGGTKTGRLSYVDPAMQQIPSRDKTTAEIVKKAFLPDEGHVWIDRDLASFEVRIFAALVSQFNSKLLEVYKRDPKTDLHQYVADLTGLPRDPPHGGAPNAKQLNLSMIFVQGAGATGAKMGLETDDDSFIDDFGVEIKFKRARQDTWDIINKYHAAVPGVRQLAEASKNIVRQYGSIRTKMGRRIRFPKGYKDYKSSGLLIQATAADYNKENWILAEDAIGDRGHLILNTHDSYSVSAEEDKWQDVDNDVKRAIEREVMGIPLLLDLNGVGRNWWAALKNEGV